MGSGCMVEYYYTAVILLYVGYIGGDRRTDLNSERYECYGMSSLSL